VGDWVQDAQQAPSSKIKHQTESRRRDVAHWPDGYRPNRLLKRRNGDSRGPECQRARTTIRTPTVGSERSAI